MITTEKLLKETGISYPTLTRLKELGIIPKPGKQGLGNRRGVIGVFPDEVLSIIKRVKEEQESGLSLTQIAEKWQQEESNKVRWATDIFAELARMYPDFDIVHGEISEIKEESDDSVMIEVKLKVKRR